MTPTLRTHEDGPKVDVQRFSALMHGPERAHERCTSRSTVYYRIVHVVVPGPSGMATYVIDGVGFYLQLLLRLR